MELKIDINQETEIAILQKDGKVFLDSKEATFDIKQIDENEFLIYKGHQVYELIVIEQKDQALLVSVDGIEMELKVKDHIALILEKLGMDLDLTETINELNAPMPGAILDISVKEGDEVKTGDTLLILEAMKMENIIKSPVDTTIGKVHVAVGDNVEKNNILISFA